MSANDGYLSRQRQAAQDRRQSRDRPPEDQGSAGCILVVVRPDGSPWPPEDPTVLPVKGCKLTGDVAPGATLTATAAGGTFYAKNLGNGTPPNPAIHPDDPTLQTYLVGAQVGPDWFVRYSDH